MKRCVANSDDGEKRVKADWPGHVGGIDQSDFGFRSLSDEEQLTGFQSVGDLISGPKWAE
jgi:hypothetical protein